MKREIIFPIEENSDYRVVCQFGHHGWLNCVWWSYVQKKFYYKKYIFFGEKKFRWNEVASCWWNREIENMDELKKAAYKLYDEKVLLPERIVKQAMDL